MYSSLNQAASMYQAEHGITFDEFDTSLDAKDFMYKYITPYMNVIKECDSILACYKDYPLTIDRTTKIMRIDLLLVLSDGAYLGISNSSVSGKVFFFDINGAKGPNYSGRDIFYFYLVNTSTMGWDEYCGGAIRNLHSGFYPGGYDNCYTPFTKHNRNDLLEPSVVHRACNKQATNISGVIGDACAAVIMMDGWQIRNDYPW